MADEKKKDDTDEEPKKKGIPAIALVALGAIAGGGGAAVMSGGAPPEEHHEPVVEYGLFDHPDLMKFSFNPLAKRGSRSAIISFRFAYNCDKTLILPPTGGAAPAAGGHGAPGGGGKGPAPLGPVPKLIKLNWHRAYSRCLGVLMQQPVERLQTAEGKEHLKRMLIDELGAALFPDGSAKVDDILWEKFYIQA